jgi:hypothetical protein
MLYNTGQQTGDLERMGIGLAIRRSSNNKPKQQTSKPRKKLIPFFPKTPMIPNIQRSTRVECAIAIADEK